MPFKSVLFAFVLVAVSWSTLSMDMFGMINTLYYKADINMDGIITEPELFSVYQGLDVNGDHQVTQDEFVGLWSELVQQTKEMATAYFFMADLDDNGVINNDDIKPVYIRFDVNGDGQVEAEEFNLKWQQIYRESPFAVMYLRTDTNGDDDLQATEYPKLFSSMDNQSDGSVRKSEFLKNWVAGNFGRDVDAQALFVAFDTNKDDVMTTAEVGAYMKPYDLNGNANLELLEVLELYKLLPAL